MNFKQNIYEEGPLGDGWILITGGSSEISKKKNEGCEVKKASDGKRYYKCPSNPNEKPWTDDLKCVTSGTKKYTNNDNYYYEIEINGVNWFFANDGYCYSSKNDQNNIWNKSYKCENGKPVILNLCDLDGTELKGKDGDPYEYKKTITGKYINYCTRKQGSTKWIYLNDYNKKQEKFLDAVKKKFKTEGGNTEVSSGSTEVSSGSTEVSSGSTEVSSGSTITKYPSIAPQNIIDEFNTKYPCLSNLKTMVNVKDDVEYYYKIEMIDEDETVYYFMSGKCKIKKPTGVESKYYRCP